MVNLPPRPGPDRLRLVPLRWWWVGSAALLVIVIGVLIGWWLWPQTAALTAAEQRQAQLDAVRTGLTAAGGTGAALALLLAVRRQRATEVALDLQGEASSDSRHDAGERRVTELYSKAAEQLGSDKAPVRLAGLHALERLAQGNPEHRQTIVNVLCAYLRMPYAPPEQIEEPDTALRQENERREQEHQVRLTAQGILSTHLRPDQDASEGSSTDRFWPAMDLDLSGATLVNFRLSGCHVRNATFVAARFTGDTRFSTARFRRVWFTRARFDGDVKFDKARFDGDAWFRSAEFNGNAWFRKAEFCGDAGFREVRFSGDVWFTRTRFSGDAWFIAARFCQDARLSEAEFNGDAKFAEVRFDGEVWIRQTRFGGAVSFHRAQFGGKASFTGSQFGSDTGFDQARFGGPTWFTGARFTGRARFTGARFRCAVRFRNSQGDDIAFLGARVSATPDSENTWPPGWALRAPISDEEGRLDGEEGTWDLLVPLPIEADRQVSDKS